MAPAKNTAVIIAAALLCSCGQSTPATGSKVRQQGAAACLTAPKVVVHNAAGQEVQGGHGAPAACVMRTGYGAAETHLRVGNDGTVFEEPAVTTTGIAGTGFAPGAPGPHPETQLSIAALAVSSDQGSHWGLLKPGGATWVGEDASLYVDRATGRLFYYGLAANPAPQSGDVPITDQVPSIQAHLLSTKDNGVTWHVASIPGFNNSENPRFTAAVAPAGQPTPLAGENVSYWCGNNMQFTFVARICYRSLDGGASWQMASILFTQGVPQHGECGTSQENFSATDGNYPQGATDGSLWTLVSCGSNTFLARSTDEAGTWPILRKAGTSDPLGIPAAEELRVDAAGILYAVHLDGSALELRTSHDGGQTWTDPLDMTAPAARSGSVFQWAFAQRGKGRVAVSYLVSRPDAGYDGYITSTDDALAGNPVFLSTKLNPDNAPLITNSQQAMDDFIDLDLGPDGSAWAAFYADCPTDGSDPSCEASGTPNPEGTATTIGRLSPGE